MLGVTAKLDSQALWPGTDFTLLWSDRACPAQGRPVFLISAQHPNQSHWNCMTKVNGSNVTFLNSAYIASDPEMSTIIAIPGQGLNNVSPSECQKSRPAVAPQQRWVAVAGSSDRAGFSLKPALSAVKHRNLLLFRELQSSLTKRHSGTSKKGSGLRRHSTYSIWYFGHKVFFGDYYPACPSPVHL